MHLEPFGLSVHAFCGTGELEVHAFFAGQVMKISSPPVVQRVITTYTLGHWPIIHNIFKKINIKCYSNTREDNTFSKQKQWCIKIITYAYFCLFSASKVIMPYGKLITRFTTGGHDIFITCPAKKACTSSPSGSRCMLFAGQASSRCMLFLRDR